MSARSRSRSALAPCATDRSREPAQRSSAARRSQRGWLAGLLPGYSGTRAQRQTKRSRRGDSLRIEPLEERRVLAATLSWLSSPPIVREPDLDEFDQPEEVTLSFTFQLT